MQFKIDAKEQYTVITPESGLLDAALAAELAGKCLSLSQKGSKNFIVDLHLCQDVRPDFLDSIISMSASCYEHEQSFVLTNPPAALTSMLKEQDAIDMVNCAPTLIEAIDIVSMEILERDLLD